ncbi:hypothetical protein [Planomonospora sp. ID82291]|uniref:hypothetical protein n=1 Tax=Planomonospora sp. ID82291 TaxID=2738136 RepID=UPI0018C3888F|nr:hypothetical protein [Planomonospora sp. ID82291]MBG0818267.1 hypothetical protein [Planomonospora sp. ID82291]
MAVRNVTFVVPPGLTVDDLRTWSMACATGKHGTCKGYRINPDPAATGEDTSLPCDCSICTHTPGGGGGRPYKERPATGVLEGDDAT